MPPTTSWTRPPGPPGVGGRLPCRPPPAAVPARAGRRRCPQGWRAPVGARRGARQRAGAAGPGGPVGPGGGQRAAARPRLEGRLRAAAGRRGVSSHGAGGLAGAVATQDTVTRLVAAIRRVRRLVGRARELDLTAHDYERPGKPECAWDDPQAKQALVSGLVNDARAVLAAVAEVALEAEQAEAVALLALVAGQDVEADQRPG